jgi:hypothetical protein
MAQRLDLSKTFVHLKNGGDTEPVAITPAFWRECSSGKRRYDRLAGIFEFRSAKDLHSSMQEMHPEADEVLFVVSGAIDVVLEGSGGERSISLSCANRANSCSSTVEPACRAETSDRLLLPPSI